MNRQLSDVLDEIDEFLQDQEDVRDGDDGQPRPNRAMQLLTDLRYSREARPEAHAPKPLTAAMDNVLAHRLGQVARSAGNPDRKDVGDSIDRGLILRRLLEEHGFDVCVRPQGGRT